MRRWRRFDERKPRKGKFVFVIGKNPDGGNFLWWGFHGTNEVAYPGDPICWIYMTPFPHLEEDEVCEKE